MTFEQIFESVLRVISSMILGFCLHQFYKKVRGNYDR